MTTSQNRPLDQVRRSFGFDPAESQHHFVVRVPRGASQEVAISEHLRWNNVDGSSATTTSTAADGQIRVVLARPKWDGIADAVRAEFNRRLKSEGLAAGAWRPEQNLLRRDLGKELVLLAWAIEDADPGLTRHAVANWQGLYPEERWWLYTQTAAASGHGLHGRNIGWRKAVRYALTENPVSDIQRDALALPEFYRQAEASAQP
ncbi:MAG: DUF3780 domain-containing protein, partial [Chloroflexi bacterium]|nr:DUF3780 domain-containing protein [Chloroflexota bacterium]